MKKVLLLLIMCSIGMCMEQPPQVGSKRGPSELEIPEAKITRAEDLEHSQQGLPDLPLEMQKEILSFILNAKGPTQLAKLNNAAEYIRNYMLTNKAFYGMLNSPEMLNFIIRELARRYTRNNDFVAVVIALATDAASRWLGQRVNQAIRVNQQGQIEIVNDEDYNFATLFNEHLINALSLRYSDVYKVLTKYMEPLKKVWFINRMRIAGAPILNYAIIYNQKEIVDDLLALEGIGINLQDEHGNMALHIAIKQEDINVVRRILSKPDLIVDLANIAGDTPLMFAILQGNLPILNELLAHGAQINLLNRDGMSPLMIAIRIENIPMINRLLQIPHINVNLQANNRSPAAIHYAIYSQKPEILQLLLSAQVNPPLDTSLKDDEGRTPLHRAIYSPFATQIIPMLLQAGANINEKDDQGFTPLMHTAIMYESDPLILLLNAGAAINERDNNNHTALWHAMNEEQEENAELLRQAGATE